MPWNIKTPELNKSKFMDALKGTASRAAEAIANMAPKPKAGPTHTVTAKCGKPGVPFRKIIRQEALPVQFIQTGVNGKTGMPRLEKLERHSFLHATKGWRVYTRGLPFQNMTHNTAPAMPRNPHRNPLCHRNAGITVINRKGAPKIHLGWRKIATVTKDGKIIPLKAA